MKKSTEEAIQRESNCQYSWSDVYDSFSNDV